MKELLGYFLLSFFSLALLSSAEDISKLDEINTQIRELQQQLDEVNKQHQETSAALQKLQGTLKGLTDKQAKTQREVAKLTEEKEIAEAALSELEEQIQRAKDITLKRVRALYVHKQGAGADTLLKTRSTSEFSRAALYLGEIKKSDTKKVEELRGLREQRQIEGKKLVDVQKKQNAALKTLTDQKQQIQNRVKEREEFLSNISREKKKKLELVGGLKAQALRLETVLRSLTGGEGLSEGPRPLKQPKKEVGGFDGEGFTKSSIQPFSGKILYKFGKYRDPDFGNESVHHRGVDFTGEGEAIAVENGAVVYVGTMPQFGKVVIVDHGSRDYSLYGRLKEVKVSQGEVLEKGASIGEASDPDVRGRTFYFEVRRAGNAVDPKSVLPK